MPQSLQSLVQGPQLPVPSQMVPAMQGTAQRPGVAAPSARPTFRLYIYPLQFSNLANLVQQTGFIKIDAKYRFICYGLSYGVFDPAAGGVTRNPQNITYRLSDTSSGAYYSNAPVKLSAVAGTLNLYHKHSVPLVLEKNTKIQVDVNPIAIVSANPPDLWLGFIGAQIAEYN